MPSAARRAQNNTGWDEFLVRAGHGNKRGIMKIKTFTGLLLALALGAGCKEQSGVNSSAPPGPKTFSSFDKPGQAEAPMGAHSILYRQADITNAFALYQELSGRSLILSPALPTNTKITFENETPLSRVEALQALDNVFAAQGIAMVYLGTKYVKVVPAAAAPSESGPIVELSPDQLPDSSSYLTYIVKLKKLKPEEATPLLQPFAKLPNSIIAMRGSDILILRDYSSNVRRMLQMLEKAEANVPSPGPVQRVLNAFGETNGKPAGSNRR